MIPIERIQETVSAITEIPISDITGKRRFREVVTARHVSIYLSKKYNPSMSLKLIGSNHGNRDHSTISVTVSKIEDLKDLYGDIQHVLNSAINKLEVENVALDS